MSAPAPLRPAAASIAAVPAREFAFDAPVTSAAFAARAAPVFALGDGTLRIAEGEGHRVIPAHHGPILAMAAAADGDLLTGGADGALRKTRTGGASDVLFEAKGHWIENIAVSQDGSSIACTAGREAIVVAAAGKPLQTPRRFAHASTAAGISFDAKGKRLAVAHYGGVSLWWSASDSHTPVRLSWRGSHLGVTYSPDGRFLVTTMQENALHGWRLADNASFQMSGFPAKVKSWSWGPRGRWLVTSGADRGLVWSFTGKQGPIGRDGDEIGDPGLSLVTATAAHPQRDLAVLGYADGSIVLAQTQGGNTALLRRGGSAAISALAWSADGVQLAAGAEDGFAAVLTFRQEAL
jgi:WD40 repeat protein